jgi:hypothetical protein
MFADSGRMIMKVNRVSFCLAIMLLAFLFSGCGGGGSSNVSVTLTEVPTGKLTGSLGTGDLAGAWHLRIETTSGGKLRNYYFVVEQTSSTTGIAFLSGIMGMTWVEIGMTGSTYIITVCEYAPVNDFKCRYVYTGARIADLITGSFVGDAEDAFFTSDAGHFTGTFRAEIVPSGAAFKAPTGAATGTFDGVIGDGLGDLSIDGDISFEISGYDVEGLIDMSVLDSYGAPAGDEIVDLPFTGSLTGTGYNEFTSTMIINQNGWTGTCTVTGYIGDINMPFWATDWANDLVGGGKIIVTDLDGHGHIDWGFRGGWTTIRD